MSRLTVDDLHFSRKGRPILSAIAFDHAPGGVLTLLGPSGSGKTTLLWLLAGLLKPDRGRITFGGDTSPRFGFVFQDGGLWEHLTAHAHLETVLRGLPLSRRNRASRTMSALSDMGLEKLAMRRPGDLSGGERQRLALARALVIEPQWLLLDEPTSQLDGPSRHDLVELMEQRLRDHPAGVILATHQVDLAVRLSDRIAVIQDGRMAQIGSPHDVYERPETLDVARLLGPAFETRMGETMRIVRPHHVRFEPDPAGEFIVRACHFAGSHWQVEARDGQSNAVIACETMVALGTRGYVRQRAR